MKRRETELMILAGAILLLATTVAAQTYTPLYTYPLTNNNTSGITWPSVMSQGQDGEFYSTIQTNGAYNYGSVYKISTGGSYNLLYSFCSQAKCPDGANPTGGVTLGFDGNLWGTAIGGGAHLAGTVFKITPAGDLTTLWSFTNGNDDSAPNYPPLQGQDGNFYGVSEAQYNGQYGAFYKMTTKGALTAHVFNTINSWTPNLPTQGTDGNFYGTTQSGGDPTCKCGAVYKATAAGKLTMLYAFKGYNNKDGSRPIGILVQGYDGNFYGTTYQGGTVTGVNNGTIFKITPGGAYTSIYSFGSVTGDGALPIAGLTVGTDGNFYGVTSAGGSKNTGIIFQVTPAGKEKILYNFCSVSCYDGIYPTTPMALHTNGKLYGNTAGNSLGGSVFYSFTVGLKPFVNLVTWSAKTGGTVEILGQGFNNTSSVSFNGTAATYKVGSDTYMTAKVPAGAGTGPVAVVTSAGTLPSNRNFLVVPTISSFSPASGPVGTAVTITGNGFSGATKVTIGGKAATFKVKTGSGITATVPTGAKTGKIVVTTPGGKATSSASFTVTT